MIAGLPPKVFLSARYSRRDELKGIRKDLQAAGYPVQSQWLDTDWTETERDAVYSSAAPPERREEYAQLDVNDVVACDVLVAFTEEPRSSSRGGRHVETGVMLGLIMAGWDKRILVVGPQENVFHHHPKMMLLPQTNDIGGLLTVSSRIISVLIRLQRGK